MSDGGVAFGLIAIAQYKKNIIKSGESIALPSPPLKQVNKWNVEQMTELQVFEVRENKSADSEPAMESKTDASSFSTIKSSFGDFQ